MIEYVDRRCQRWARQVVDQMPSTHSIFSKILQGQSSGGRGHYELIDSDAEEIERIVNLLPRQCREIICVHYLGADNIQQRLKRIRVGKTQYYARLNQAHAEIEQHLFGHRVKKSLH